MPLLLKFEALDVLYCVPCPPKELFGVLVRRGQSRPLLIPADVQASKAYPYPPIASLMSHWLQMGNNLYKQTDVTGRKGSSEANQQIG